MPSAGGLVFLPRLFVDLRDLISQLVVRIYMAVDLHDQSVSADDLDRFHARCVEQFLDRTEMVYKAEPRYFQVVHAFAYGHDARFRRPCRRLRILLAEMDPG